MRLLNPPPPPPTASEPVTRVTREQFRRIWSAAKISEAETFEPDRLDVDPDAGVDFEIAGQTYWSLDAGDRPVFAVSDQGELFECSLVPRAARALDQALDEWHEYEGIRRSR